MLWLTVGPDNTSIKILISSDRVAKKKNTNLGKAEAGGKTWGLESAQGGQPPLQVLSTGARKKGLDFLQPKRKNAEAPSEEVAGRNYLKWGTKNLLTG